MCPSANILYIVSDFISQSNLNGTAPEIRQAGLETDRTDSNKHGAEETILPTKIGND